MNTLNSLRLGNLSLTGNAVDAKECTVSRGAKNGDRIGETLLEGRGATAAGMRRKKGRGGEKMRICRVVLIMATGVITCNYREEWFQRSMNAVWRAEQEKAHRRGGCR